MPRSRLIIFINLLLSLSSKFPHLLSDFYRPLSLTSQLSSSGRDRMPAYVLGRPRHPLSNDDDDDDD